MRLIDADALKKRMCEICNDDYSDEPCEPSDCVFCNAIKDAPTIDAVPVVRCKECKWKTSWYKIDYGNDICGVSGLYPRTETDYCPYGERKDGDG